jgi:GntR family phosphonate transport system transcriptional regulator
VDRDNPQWQRIAQTLRAEIATSGWQAGVRLPSESALAARFGVNRHTVRQALQSLAEEGVLTIRRGAGSFVTGPVIDYPISARTRFTEIIIGQGLDASGEVIDWRAEKATPVVAKALGIRAGTAVSCLRRICRANEVIVGLGWHRLPARRFKNFGPVAKQHAGITAALKVFGVSNYQRRETHITARVASRTEARMLQSQPGGPVLVTEYVNYDDSGRAIEHGESLFLPERVRLVVGGAAA